MFVNCPVNGWARPQQKEARQCANRKGGNRQRRNAGTEPEFEHRNVVPRSALNDSERASLGDNQRDSLSDQNT